MAKININFSLLAVAVCLGFAQDAFSAPSVKRLGMGNSYAGISNAVAAKSGSVGRNTGTTGVRAASVRNVGGGTVKSTTSSKTSSVSNNANASRLSVGKYLHVAGVKDGIIKPAGSGTPGNSGINTNNYYTKEETYTKQEIDAKFGTLPALDNYYTKDEINTTINNYYTKDEIDTYRDGLDGLYATKTSVETLNTDVNGNGGLAERVTALENGHVAGESASDWCDEGPSWMVATDPNCY